MLQRRFQPNFIINNPPVSNYSAIIEKVTCPICCIVFQKKYTPMIACPSGHTICANCLEGIVKKAVETPQNPASCPLCRKRIELPLQLNEEYTEFVNLLESIGELMFLMASQSEQLKLKISIISTLELEMKIKKNQLLEAMKKTSIVEKERDLLKQENKNLKKTIQDLTKAVKKGRNIQTDAEGQQKIQKSNMIRLENPCRIPNKQIEIDSRRPLKELYEDEQLESNNRLNLMRKQYSIHQIDFIIFYDLSTLIELNLACNKIANCGFNLLVEKSNFVNLTNLNVANNLISELPANIIPLTKLQYFNIGNFLGEDRRTCNRLKQSQMDKILAHKWEDLKTLDIEFGTDLVWDNEANLDKLIEQWPVVSMIHICTFTMKMAKKKCQQLGKTLNSKVKRPGLNRIYVGIKNSN